MDKICNNVPILAQKFGHGNRRVRIQEIFSLFVNYDEKQRVNL